MRRKNWLGTMAAVFLGASMLVGCEAEKQDTTTKDMEVTAKVEATAKAEDTTIFAEMEECELLNGSCHFLDDNVVLVAAEGEHTFFEWTVGKSTMLESHRVDKNMKLDGEKVHINFDYVVLEDKLYVANNACDTEDGDVQVEPGEDDTNQVYFSVEKSDGSTSYTMNIDTNKVEKSNRGIASEKAIAKKGDITSYMTSSDGKYELLTVEKDENTVEYLVDLKKDAYINLNKELGAGLNNVRFVDEHTLVYMELDSEPESLSESQTGTYKALDPETQVVTTLFESLTANAIKDSYGDGILYYGDNKVQVLSIANQKMAETTMASSDCIEVITNKDNKKCVVVAYEDGASEDEQITITDMVYVDWGNGTAKTVSNVDSDITYGIELDARWTADNTVTFATDEELVSYTFAEK